MTSLPLLHSVLPCKDGVQEDLGEWRSTHLALLLLVSLMEKRGGGEEGRGRGTEGGNNGKEGREILS